MSKHRAPRYVRTREVLVGLPVAAGVSAVTLGLLAFPAQATPGTPPAVVATAAAPADQYTVRPGDTLGKIAAAHGQPWQELHQRNLAVIGADPNVITPGQVLLLSGAGEVALAPAPEPVPVLAAQSAVATITNGAGPVRPHVQAAADAVVTDVPGAAALTIGGTRPGAADMGGHPAGLALDFMVMSDAALGNAIVQYHVANWDSLGVNYIIWQQRMLTSPTGSWSQMEDRGSVTANHFDHPHVSYQAR